MKYHIYSCIFQIPKHPYHKACGSVNMSRNCWGFGSEWVGSSHLTILLPLCSLHCHCDYAGGMVLHLVSSLSTAGYNRTPNSLYSNTKEILPSLIFSCDPQNFLPCAVFL